MIFPRISQVNDRSKSQSQQATRTRGPPILDQCAILHCFGVERGRNGREAGPRGATSEQRLFRRSLHARVVEVIHHRVPPSLRFAAGSTRSLWRGEGHGCGRRGGAPRCTSSFFPFPLVLSAGNNALRAGGGLHLRRLRHWRDPDLAPALSRSFCTST